MKYPHFSELNRIQFLFATCYWICIAPYLLLSAINQLVIYNAALAMFKADLKIQEWLVIPYRKGLNRLEEQTNKETNSEDTSKRK